MQQRMAPMVAGAVLGLAALGVTGCGSSSTSASAGSNGEQGKPAQQIFDDAKAALAAATSAHVKGTDTSDGKPSTIDARFQGQDSDVSETDSGETLHIIKKGGSIYIQAPASFWKEQGGPTGAAVADRLANKWLIVDAATAQQVDVSLQNFAKELSTADSPLKAAVGSGSVNGHRVLVLTQQDGSTLEVAATGQPVPLRATNKGSSKGALDFTDYGADQGITAPQGAVTPQQAAQSTGGAGT
jgi:hypothetical protein